MAGDEYDEKKYFTFFFHLKKEINLCLTHFSLKKRLID